MAVYACRPFLRSPLIPSLSIPSRSFFGFPPQQSASPTPQEYSTSRTYNHSPKQLYQIVADVESYPSFLPFCTGASLIVSSNRQHLQGGKEGDIVKLRAQLGVGFLGVSEQYTSLVTCKKWSQVIAQASGTPLFHQLDTTWTLTPTSTSTPENPITNVSLTLVYCFVNPFHQTLANLSFAKVSNDVLSAFDVRVRGILQNTS